MKTSFQELLILAWKSTFSCRKSWIFGLIISFVAMKERILLSPLHDALSFQEAIISVLHKYDSVPFFIAGIFLLFVVRIFGRSNLVVVLDTASKKPTQRKKLTATRMIRIFFRAAFFELFSLGVILLTIATLCLPVWVAFRYNDEALGVVIALSIATALVVFPVVFFVLEFAFFYFLLARIRFFSSIENGALLFSRYRGRSIAFGFFYAGLLVAFTFSLNLVMLTIVVFSRKIGLGWAEETISFLGSFFFIAWFSIIEQSLRLFFFKDLARPQEKEEQILVNETSPEVPRV